MNDHPNPLNLNPFGEVMLELLRERGMDVAELAEMLRQETGEDISAEEIWSYLLKPPPDVMRED